MWNISRHFLKLKLFIYAPTEIIHNATHLIEYVHQWCWLLLTEWVQEKGEEGAGTNRNSDIRRELSHSSLLIRTNQHEMNINLICLMFWGFFLPKTTSKRIFGWNCMHKFVHKSMQGRSKLVMVKDTNWYCEKINIGIG